MRTARWRSCRPITKGRDVETVGPCRTLIVAAASRHGGTGEIADRLAGTMQSVVPANWLIIRSDLSDLRVFDEADAAVLGSAVYFGHWMRPAARALEYLRDMPVAKLWLFSTGPVSETETENAQIVLADSVVKSGEAVEHKVFGGRLDTSRLSWLERTVVKAVHALPGDHRDWELIDEWACRIVEQLTTPSPGAQGTSRTSPNPLPFP